MNRFRTRVMAGAALVAAAGFAVGCDTFLDVDIEGEITSSSVGSPSSSDALRLAVLASVHGLTSGVSTGGLGLGSNRGLWNYTGNLTDEWKSSSSNAEMPEIDRRQATSGNSAVNGVYNLIHDTRSRAHEAIAALNEFLPTSLYLGQMYFMLGLSELALGEAFCNGTPLSGQTNGVVVYGAPLTNAEVFAVARIHFDSALGYLTATDATTLSWNRAAKLLKARTLINLGGAANFTAAVAEVNGILTDYTFQNTFSSSVAENNIFQLNNGNVSHQQVGDSLNPNPGLGIVQNAIPFASAGDPRVPTFGSSVTPSPLGNGNDSNSPRVNQLIWTSATSAVNIVSGLDARLIEAEADLQANNDAGTVAKLNTLRASTIVLSPSLTYTANALPPLAVPATHAEAVSLFFREKAFWTFGRGQRHSDMRRMIRQYGRAANTVFPEGIVHNSGLPYGSGINFPIPTSEGNNPNVVPGANGDYCLDRAA